MPSSRIPSPARSQGAKSTPRRYKPRASRSVGSPALSTSSVKLSAVIQMDSFALSPMPTRRSVLTDTTDIDIPRRKSWWKKLDENSREIMEVLNNKDPAEANNAIEEYIEVDVLSQEKKNYTMDIPESSDGESISSIVIPQRKLFTQKESKTQKNFAQMIDNRESLAPLHQTQGDNDKTINVGRKNLFSQSTKRRTKPLFPSALLNISANKTIANKTKELAAADPKAQVKSLFGNRPGAKRKNMFANFVVSDESEDEIPEIQPKVFEFQKKSEQKRRRSVNSRTGREDNTSPTSSMTDIEIDDWRLLPSSTMVDHQLEDGFRATPSKRAKLGKLSEATETINTENNTTRNKTKQSNKSLHSKSKSKNVSQLHEEELIEPRNNDSGLNIVQEKKKPNNRNSSREHSLKEQTIKNKDYSKSKNVSVMKIVNEVTSEVNVFEGKNAETIIKSYNKSSKAFSKIDQVFQSDDDEDISLVYENDDHIEGENEGSGSKISNEVEDPKETSIFSKQNKSKAHTILDQENRQSNDEDLINQQRNKSYNTSLSNLRNANDKQCQGSRFENEGDKIIDKYQNNCEKEIDTCKHKQYCSSDKTDVKNKKLDDNIDDVSNQDLKNPQKLISDVDFNGDTSQDKQTSTQQEEETNTTDANISQKKRSNNGEISEEEEKELQYSDKDEDEDEEIDQDEDEEIDQDEDEEIDQDEDEEIDQDEDEEIDQDKDEEIDQNDEEQTSNSRDLEKEQKIEEKRSEDDNLLTIEVTQSNDKVGQNHIPHDEIDNENKYININQSNSDKKIRSNATPKNKKVNPTNDSTSNSREKLVASPEVILHDEPAQIESFTVQGPNTSERKTKSVIKNFTIRQSLAPVRESNDFSNGSKNSTAEGSGWDSHRTTRATLRQTFGKDFTPRKSLRTLVMEKAAKRQTNFTENNAEISRLPQANSTELPESTRFAINQSNDEAVLNKSKEEHIMNNSGVAQKNMSDQKVSNIIKSDDSQHIREVDRDSSSMSSRHNDSKNNNIEEAQEMDISNQEVSHNIDDFDDESNQDSSTANDNDSENNKNEESQEVDISNEEVSHKIDFDEDAKNDESDQAHESNESDNEDDINESDQAVSREMRNSDGAQNDDEYDYVQEMQESHEDQESNESEQEMSQDDEHEEMNSQEIEESIHDVSGENNDAHEESQMDVVQEMNESENAQEIDESDEGQDYNEIDDEQNVNESVDEQDVNESEDEHETNYSNNDLSLNKDDEEIQEMENGREESRKTRQTTLEMYLQKIKRQNIERKKQLEQEIRNSLKAPARNMLNPFKVPAVPKLRRVKAQQIKPKEKPVKSSVVPLNMLPAEVLADMKYKPPKRYRPTNASWITKRLYKYLETKLEPKYDYKARVRSEKLVETIYNFTKDIRRHDVAPSAAVDALKHEMARLDVVKTHFEFYEFFHEYMPREVRVKVVPDVFNKISLPKYGVFSDILR